MDFEIELNNATNNILDALSGVCTDVGLEIMTALTAPPPKGTPRDTGWASANWLYAPTIPNNNPVGSKQSVPSALSAQYESFSELAGRINRDYTSYYIYNNVPYIGKLNSVATPSKQSPPFFIEMAVQRGTKNVRLNLLRAKRGANQK